MPRAKKAERRPVFKSQLKWNDDDDYSGPLRTAARLETGGRDHALAA